MERSRLNRGIWGVLIFLAALLTVISLFSYDVGDRSFNTPSGVTDTHNWGGFVGAYLADFLSSVSVNLFAGLRVLWLIVVTIGFIFGVILIYRKQDSRTRRYIESHLMAGEKIIYRTKLHWIVFFWPTMLLVCGGAGFWGVSAETGLLFAVPGVCLWLASCVPYVTSEFGVTDKRVLVKVGFIRRDTMETLLTKVEGIGVHQSFLGRLLGYGTIVVTGTGGSKEPFNNIESPLEFRTRVHEQIAGHS